MRASLPKQRRLCDGERLAMEFVRLRESSERQVLDRRDPTRLFRSDFLSRFAP